MDATIVEVEVTGYGLTAAEDGRVTVFQTGQRLGSIPGRAVRATQARDWQALFRLYRRSPKLRMTVQPRYQSGEPVGCRIAISYGAASLAYLAIPGKHRGISLRDAWRSIGVEMPAACGTWG